MTPVGSAMNGRRPRPRWPLPSPEETRTRTVPDGPLLPALRVGVQAREGSLHPPRAGPRGARLGLPSLQQGVGRLVSSFTATETRWSPFGDFGQHNPEALAILAFSIPALYIWGRKLGLRGP